MLAVLENALRLRLREVQLLSQPRQELGFFRINAQILQNLGDRTPVNTDRNVVLYTRGVGITEPENLLQMFEFR